MASYTERPVLRVRLSKRPSLYTEKKKYYAYYVTIPIRLIELFGLKEGDEFILRAEMKDKLRLILELAK